jgi:HD superfamily phosphohydrolase
VDARRAVGRKRAEGLGFRKERSSPAARMSSEREILNSRPVQRLRDIHQLALTYLVYPGSTHRRFEHSLGTMELSSRIYAVIMRRDHVQPEVQELLPHLVDDDAIRYWRRVLRIAALCHDLGHLPFSHAAESELLRSAWNHERVSRVLIESLGEAFRSRSAGPIDPEHVVKLALGTKNAPDLTFSRWETC